MSKIKRIISVTLSILLVLSSVPIIAVADTSNDGYLTYTISNDEATITDCDTSISGDYEIPSTLGGYPVTSIGDSAFSFCTSLESVTIPDSVTTIGAWAFEYCTSLESVTIPDSVTSIGKLAFYYCTSLESITVDERNTYYSSDEYGALFNKDKTELIKFPEGSSVTSYSIPDSVTSIGDYAFNLCTSLTSITIPDSVTSIGDQAFEDCKSLESITVDERNTYYSSDEYGVLFNKVQTMLIQFPAESSVTSYSIPDSVTTIGYHAFYSCKSLESVIIPDSVTTIGVQAFSYCTSLESVIIGNSVTTIGAWAFSDCTSLTSITIPDSVTSIDSYAFDNTAYSNNESNWEDGVLYIGNHLIDAQRSISGSYGIKAGTKTLAGGAFSSCTSLESVTIPDSVTTIGAWAFEYCTSLESVTIPDSVTSIGNRAFYNTAYYNNESNWEDGVLYIGNHLIGAQTSISGSYGIKAGTKTLAGGAFYNCTSLESITIPDSVTSIGVQAFSYCTSLKSVTIPDSVTSIGDWAFSGCTSLTSITIPDSVTTIYNMAFGYYEGNDYETYFLIDGFTIYGYDGTAAETYANENGITFVSLGEYIAPEEPSTEEPTIEFDEDSKQVTLPAETGIEGFKQLAAIGSFSVTDAEGNALSEDALIGTGCKVQTFDENGNVISEYEVIVPSDVDGNGKITAADARLALRTAAQLDTLEGVYLIAADFDADTAVKPADARSILRVAAKLE